MSKYINRHICMAFSEDVALKKKSIGKSFSELSRKDFKNRFIKLWWSKCRGLSILNKNGKFFSKNNVHDFTAAMYIDKEQVK